jgi:putative cardiolipin synthase
MKTAPVAQALAVAAMIIHLAGCSALPPGADFPKRASRAYVDSARDRLEVRSAEGAPQDPGDSAFRMLALGEDGFAVRVQLVRAAKHSLDLQYFIFRADSTGSLLTESLLAAADHGVKVRILVDDGSTVAGDEQIEDLAAHPNIEVRVFNPFRYRGHLRLLRALDFAIERGRVDYRMHNKLFVADNSMALVGGRNVGDEYFQVSPDEQFADDDVFVSGPVVPRLSATFDDYWNSALAIPAQALAAGDAARARARLERRRSRLKALWQDDVAAGIDYVERADGGEPLNSILAGRPPLVWSRGVVICDSPDKKAVLTERKRGRLLYPPVAAALARVHSEFLMITPYLIPTPEELALLRSLLERNVRVRILTNSLDSTNELSAHSGYMRYRRQLLSEGVELYELRRALSPTSRGTGQVRTRTTYGNYGLHAKLLIFDRSSLYAGSMNFDERSRLLNTEVGVIVDSPALAAETAARFEAMTQPQSAYSVTLRPVTAKERAVMVWRTLEDGKPVEYTREPSRSVRRRIEATLLSLLPMGREL